MSEVRRSNPVRNFLLVAIPLTIIALPFVITAFGTYEPRERPAGETFLELPAEPNSGCVRETEYMRYHHWELLWEVRDEFVRVGRRGDISLAKCRECHPNRERFCNQCHRAVSLQPDCFGCHYYPETPSAAVVANLHVNGTGR
jgi:hypothetical protein